jgi:hypothetical protein
MSYITSDINSIQEERICPEIPTPYIITERIEPSKHHGIDILNTGKYGRKYDKLDCHSEEMDGRLIDAVGRKIILDRNLLNPIPSEANLYTDDINSSYGKSVYKNYSEIKNGDITYYNSIQDVYRSPVFTKSKVIGSVYTDPMGTESLEYRRVVNNNRCKNDDMHCNAWVKDSQNFREDMLSLQMSRMNRNQWYHQK